MDQFDWLSAECKHLLKRMLDKNPEKRITLRDIIAHPWISKYKEDKMRSEWGYTEDEVMEGSFAVDVENEYGVQSGA